MQATLEASAQHDATRSAYLTAVSQLPEPYLARFTEPVPTDSGGIDDVDDDAGNAQQPTNVLAERLRHLLETVHPANRGPYTLEEVSAGIRQQSGQSLSAPYLNQLKLGRRDNLTTTKLEAIARFFGVPVGYFFDDTQAQAVDEELALLQAIRDGGIKELALRALELDPETVKSVSRFVGELGQRTDQSKRKGQRGPAED